MIIAAGAGKLARMTAAEAARIMPDGDPRTDPLKRITGPAGADVIDVFFLVDPGMAWPREIERARRPVVVLVADDPGTPWGQGGASAWCCASRLRRWTRAALVHGAAAQPDHYTAVVQAALRIGRCTLVETTSANLRGWAEALRCPRTLLVKPYGGLHPIPDAEAVY